MDGEQTWNQSRTILTLIIGMIAPIVAFFGYTVEDQTKVALVNALALVWTGAAMVIAAIYRVKATKVIVSAAQIKAESTTPTVQVKKSDLEG